MSTDNIIRVESLEDVEPGVKISIGPDSTTITRAARCAWEDWEKVVDALMEPDELKTGPNTDPRYTVTNYYPGFPFCRADTIEVSSWGQCIKSDWGVGPTYEKADLTITYKTAEQPDDKGENGDQPDDQPFLVQRVNFSCEMIVVPMLVGDGSDANGQPKKREVKRHIRFPTVVYEAQVSGILQPNWAQINDMIGKISTEKMFSGKAGTVLFDGLTGDRELRRRSRNMSWKLGFKFIYNRQGWNKTIHPDTLNWVDAADVSGGGRKPYEETDLRWLFTNGQPFAQP